MAKKKLKDSMSHEPVDRISNLPEPIVHHILSYLPTKDVDKTSALSKTFLSSWSSFPVIVLQYHNFIPKEKGICKIEAFKDSLHPRIQRRNINTDLQKFQLTVHGDIHGPERDHRIDEAVNFAMQTRVKKLHLNFMYPSYTLPRFTNSFNSITSLTLRGLILNNLDHLIVRCPLIETLLICYCSALKYFVISSKTIKSIVLQRCTGLEHLNIESPSLEKFVYNGLKYSEIDGYVINSSIINITECKFLKELSLAYAKITDEWVGNTIPLLVQLEDLKFIGCRELKDLKISNDNLKRLTLLECIVSLERLKIVGRNFQSLSFNGSPNCAIEYDTPRHVSFISSHAEIPSYARYIREVSKATWSIQAEGLLHDIHFVALLDFFRYFRFVTDLTLICNSSEKLVIPEKLRGRKIYSVYSFINIKIKGISSISTELVDSLLWLFPFLNTLCFDSDGVERSIEFHRDWEAPKDGTILCCSDLRGKCWRHYFKKLQMNNFDTVDGINLRQYFAENGKVVDTIN